ncbi:hypothetical protein KR018_007112, partial [Drosophila ironensis]
WRLKIRLFSKAGESGKLKDAFKRLGTSPRNNRDPPKGCVPECLNTEAFEAPKYIPAATFRILDPDEQIGPKAGKSETYKNPEYYCYFRFSYYTLKTIVRDLRVADKKSK